MATVAGVVVGWTTGGEGGAAVTEDKVLSTHSQCRHHQCRLLLPMASLRPHLLPLCRPQPRLRCRRLCPPHCLRSNRNSTMMASAGCPAGSCWSPATLKVDHQYRQKQPQHRQGLGRVLVLELVLVLVATVTAVIVLAVVAAVIVLAAAAATAIMVKMKRDSINRSRRLNNRNQPPPPPAATMEKVVEMKVVGQCLRGVWLGCFCSGSTR